MKFGNYIFTDKKHSKKSIMSTILGLIAIVSLISAMYKSFLGGGIADSRYGSAAFLALVFAIIGLVLAIWGRAERDRFYLFAYIGMILNILSIALVSAILYAGALWF